MAGARIPGPQSDGLPSWLLQDGTLALWHMPAPGPVYTDFWLTPARASTFVPVAPDVGVLFRACFNPTRGLTDADYERAAAALQTDIPSIRAVAEVETSGEAFDDLGRPRILFERHYFHRSTSGRYSATHAAISASKAGGYGKFSEQYNKLEEAYGLDPDAALRSASWGRFQIMGENHRAAGFPTVFHFVEAMMKSEAAHLDAFVSFVNSNPAMATALREHDWAGFARRYNGAGYRKNLYDDKMRAAYERFLALEQAARDAAPSAPSAGSEPTLP